VQAEMFGILGVILAPPLAVTTQILFEQLFTSPTSMDTQEMIESTEALKKQLSRLETRVRQRGSNVPEETIRKMELVQKLTDRLIDHHLEKY
jgi:hypothetical protein